LLLCPISQPLPVCRFGYVVFDSEDTVERVMKDKQGQQLDGETVFLDYTDEKSSHAQGSKKEFGRCQRFPQCKAFDKTYMCVFCFTIHCILHCVIKNIIYTFSCKTQRFKMLIVFGLLINMNLHLCLCLNRKFCLVLLKENNASCFYHYYS